MSRGTTSGFWRGALRFIGWSLRVGVIGVTGGLLVGWCLEGRHDNVVWAARDGGLATVRRLAPWDVYLSRNGFDEDMPPLTAAAAAGQTEVVRFLLRRGVDVNALDDGGRTALYQARLWGQPGISRMIVQAGGR